MDKLEIKIEDVEAIRDHKLFVKGSSLIPARFWEYRLVNINRPYDEEKFLAQDFVEVSLEGMVTIHNGIQYSFLVN